LLHALTLLFQCVCVFNVERIMIKVPPPLQFRKGRGSRRRPYNPAPPTAFALISASYIPNSSVTLVFNEPIDVSQIVTDMITVADGEVEGVIMIGVGAPTLENPTTVVIAVEPFDPYQGSGTFLTASDGAGIRSATGEVWEGVDGLSLPFEA
jgi:hypothetical protein